MNIVAHSIPISRLPRYGLIYGAMLSLMLLMAQTIAANARGAPDSFADLAERLSPAVVNITTRTNLVRPSSSNRPALPENSPFGDFFKDFFENGPNQPFPDGGSRRGRALGSGFVISADGLIVTNNHVIDKADEIMIEFRDGTELQAELIGRDANTDIAVLQVDADGPLEFVEFGESDTARVGDWVLAIGNPLGQGFSVSAGIISARNRSLDSGPYDDFIQTDAAINRGNSGGPLFDMDGSVIGVNTAIISPNGGSIGLGFAMSSAVVERVVDQLIEFGETRRGWLGVQIQEVDEDLAAALGLDDTNGALVSGVPDGPSADAGIQPGDVILNFDGEKIADDRALVTAVGNAPVGKAVDVVIFRDGQSQTLQVVLGRREDAIASSDTSGIESPDPEPTVDEALGLTLSEIDDELRTELALPEEAAGVAVIEVDENSDAFEKGMRAGDIIVEVNQEQVETPQDVASLMDAVRDAGRKSVLLTVARGENRRFVGLSLEQ